jgi:hypothetical protein
MKVLYVASQELPPNLERLREAIVKQYEQMRSDCIAYAHDLAHVKALRVNDPPTNPPWHKLDAM